VFNREKDKHRYKKKGEWVTRGVGRGGKGEGKTVSEEGKKDKKTGNKW
jgi:hypothetical protein